MSKSAAAGTAATIAATRGSKSARIVVSLKRWSMTASAAHLRTPSSGLPVSCVTRPTQDWKSSTRWASQWRLKPSGDQRPPARLKRGVAAGRHAVDADLVELQQGCEARIAADRVDGPRHLLRPDRPAVGPGVAVVDGVVGMMLRHGDDETGLDQAARQVGMHPGVAARAVRDDDEAAVAARRHGVGREQQHEAAARQRSRLGRGRIEDRHRAVLRRRGDLGQADGGPGQAARQQEARWPGRHDASRRAANGKGNSSKRSSSKATGLRCGRGCGGALAFVSPKTAGADFRLAAFRNRPYSGAETRSASGRCWP